MASSSTQLAKPIFIEGVDNALSVVDAYTGQAKGVINSATNQFKAASGSILDALRHLNIKDNLSFLKGLLSGKLNINAGMLLDRLGATFPQLKGIAEAYNSARALGKDFEAALREIYDVYQDILSEVNGILGILDGTDFESAQALSDMVNKLSNGNYQYSLQDPNSQAALYSAMINQSLKMNIPGVLDAFVKQVDNYVTLKVIISAVGKEIINTSHIDALTAAADNNDFASLLMQVYPSFIHDFMKEFKLHPKAKEEDFEKMALTILQAFRKLDKGWDQYLREGNEDTEVVTYDITSLLYASSDMKRVLMVAIANSKILFEKLYAFMIVFSPMSVKRRIQMDFPSFVFGTTTTPKAQFINPIQLMSSRG